MERILAISICYFSEKIHFLSCLLDLDLQIITKQIKILNKMMITNQVQDYMSKNCELRVINSSLNSHMKTRLTLLGEIMIIFIYESHLESNHVLIINNRFIESLISSTKTKKIKIDILLRKYHEVLSLIYDSLFYLDPRLRLNPKVEIFSANQIINVYQLIYLAFHIH